MADKSNCRRKNASLVIVCVSICSRILCGHGKVHSRVKNVYDYFP